jgi:Fic family protein
MKWIWQQKDWPLFAYNAQKLMLFENKFHKNSGLIVGSVVHLEEKDVEQLKIELLTQEALSTSVIEGEILKRESVQSSIRKHFGLKTDNRKVQANEAGIAEMMVDVYVNYNKPLTHQKLFLWHKMLTNGRRDLEVIGNYRKHKEPMQIISGNLSAPKLFYEAPPSKVVKAEMTKFINWYNAQIKATEGLPVLIFAGIVHLYFEIIHPFEDGNGRIGRALVEKAISQKLQTPALNSFAKIIESNKKEYYAALQTSSFNVDIDKWLLYFCNTLLKSQQYSIDLVSFMIAKTKFFNKFKDTINERQLKVLLRIFEEGIEGFKGGLSAANYKKISNASSATATRDLQELVNLKALTKTGELKHTRYFLNLS